MAIEIVFNNGIFVKITDRITSFFVMVPCDTLSQAESILRDYELARNLFVAFRDGRVIA